jgi:hypothetical protein
MTRATDKTVPKQLKPFKPGQSGNPNGRPKGSRNAATLALESLLDGLAEALTQKASIPIKAASRPIRIFTASSFRNSRCSG